MNKKYRFGSITFYLVDPDLLDMDPPKYTIKYPSRKSINNTTDNFVPVRHIVKIVQ